MSVVVNPGDERVFFRFDGQDVVVQLKLISLRTFHTAQVAACQDDQAIVSWAFCSAKRAAFWLSPTFIDSGDDHQQNYQNMSEHELLPDQGWMNPSSTVSVFASAQGNL